MSKLIKEYQYGLAVNCVPIPGKTMLGADIELEENMYVDNRFRMVTTTTIAPLKEYINYLFVINENIKSYITRTDEGKRGKFVALLELGYMPVFMPPTHTAKVLEEVLVDKIKASGIDYVEELPLTLTGRTVQSDAKDIWVSKLSIAKKFNINIEDIDVISFIKEVWKK